MKAYTYPDRIEIKPLTKPVNATIRVPPSKSITNRALVLAALSCRKGPCRIKNMLWAEDTEVMVDCLRRLGFNVAITEGEFGADAEISTTNPDVIIPASEADLYCGNSGTTMRFLTAMVALGHGRYRLDGDARMRERPIEDLLDALWQLGVDAKSESGNGCPPVILNSHKVTGTEVVVRSNVSSQYASALLLVMPFAHSPFWARLDGATVSMPYVQMTRRFLLAQIGVKTDAFEVGTLKMWKTSVPHWKGDCEVEPDATAGGYFLAAAAITAGNARLRDLHVHVPRLDEPIVTLQGDVELVNELIGMGCTRDNWSTGLGIVGRPLHGITADLNHIPDTAMTLAAVACFADSPTTIRNVAHIRHKECDRIAAMTTELRKLGVEVEEYPDGWKITPRPMHGAELETYNDHRIAMSLALIGLKVPGVVIKNPGCVAKTYPGFWEDFEKLYE